MTPSERDTYSKYRMEKSEEAYEVAVNYKNVKTDGAMQYVSWQSTRIP